MAEILDDGAKGSPAAMSELRSRINTKIALYEKAVPQGMPSFLRHIPNTETYQVNEPNADTARKAGFKVGVKYVIDENDPKGFIVDVASNTAADPTGAKTAGTETAAEAAIAEYGENPFGENTPLRKIQVDLTGANQSVAEEINRAYSRFAIAGNKRQMDMLDYMLANKDVRNYLLNMRDGRLLHNPHNKKSMKAREAMLADPLTWFASIAASQEQLPRGNIALGAKQRSVFAEDAIEEMYSGFGQEMNLTEQ